MQKKQDYYLGLDIGTNSVGYAVTDEAYNLLRFHGSDAWGVTIFDEASQSAERRSFRSGRRRLDRRQQRVQFLQEIFAREIAKADDRFFLRLKESYLWREDTQDQYIFFNDADYTDVQYFAAYPTIHHLIYELMNSSEKHDVRLIYLACAWLVAHRGHFLSNIDVKNLNEIQDITASYERFESFFTAREYRLPWNRPDLKELGNALKQKIGVTAKKSLLTKAFLGDEKPSKTGSEEFPFSQDALIRLLAGGSCKLKELFLKGEYEELGSITLYQDEEKFTELMTGIGEDYDLIEVLRGLYDWSVLADILGEEKTISASKVKVYEQHEKDLKTLKYFIRKYCPDQYDEVFRKGKEDNYAAYSYHFEGKNGDAVKRKAGIEEFSKYILKIVGGITPVDSEVEALHGMTEQQLYDDMKSRLELRMFLPKQKNTDNRVIPHQLYLFELNKILEKAAEYLPFLNEAEDGVSNKDKIVSIFEYKLPYFVGPLNEHSSFAWVKKKEGKITPWNYKDMIDFDESEEAFIQKLTGMCTYLPGETVAPKDSLCYQKFMVLNEINNIKINGTKISATLKQSIYHDLFEKKKKVRRKDIIEYLISNGYIAKGEEDALSGLNDEIHATLSSYLSFRKLLQEHVLTEDEVEDIIARASYAEDKTRVLNWLKKKYSKLTEEDRRYIAGIKIKDFGRLSAAFLKSFEGANKEIGEVTTILQTMWETNDNLMEVLSDRYTFMEHVNEERAAYYDGKKLTLDERLNQMYVSNAVKRPIYRTMDIVGDVCKAFGAPRKIFVEMTRGDRPDLKGKRTSSRKEQILALYDKCRNEEVRDLKHQLEEMGAYVDNKLQGDRLFLYFMQFGISAYSGKPIQLENLMSGSGDYDIDHIYPQAYVKDDSILNNKVLVLCKENEDKSDIYPIHDNIRRQMAGIWKHWKEIGAIGDEKFKRLTRGTPFTDEERYGFINRQMTETSQSTKAVATLLKERFPDAEIVYSKAGLTSDFRHEFGLTKSRGYNDLHHAVDAYLNIVAGNVYHMRFSRQWFSVHSTYSLKTKTIFTRDCIVNGQTVWDGEPMLQKVIRTARKNTAHFTKYAFFKTGGFFDQMPLKKSEGLVPLKKGMPTEKYGGYNKPGVMFYIPVRYRKGKKTEIFVMSVELLYGKRFLSDEAFAKEYAFDRLHRILGKPVDEVSFPMGMRPWKVNTVLSLDGFRVCISGVASGGRCLIAQPIMQFAAENFWLDYFKKAERFVEKSSSRKNYIYDETYDVVCKEKNEKLYDLYTEKLRESIYRKRMNSPIQLLVDGREQFGGLDVQSQCRTLLNIHQVFGRMTGGCDLTSIGGKEHSAATVSFSATISNWRKNNYTDVRVIDQSASGLWEKQSENLLDLL